MFNGFLIACSMYTRIPIKQVDWFDQGRKYVLFCLPIIGCIIGGVWWLAYLFLASERLITSVLITLVPYLICGFIHLDGFLDCMDALLSSANKEKKVNILKDSHVGAFAVLSAIILFLLNVASIASLQVHVSLFLIPIISRIFAIELQYSSPVFSSSEMSKHFMEGVTPRIKKLFQLFPVFLGIGSMYFMGYQASILWGYALLHYVVTRKWLLREFDGINGDMCGFMIESMQCGCLIVACFI